MASKERITAERLRELMHYDPETGIFTWRVSRGGTTVGARAGSLSGSTGYFSTMVDGRNYGHARLAWLYMTGEWGPPIVDHKDTVRTNDRWNNLRAATYQQNNANMNLASHNTSGIKGVGWHKQTGKWRAYISVDDRQVHLGLHATKDLAIEAYRKAAQETFGEFARVG